LSRWKVVVAAYHAIGQDPPATTSHAASIVAACTVCGGSLASRIVMTAS
jgi:hypothetical protein